MSTALPSLAAAQQCTLLSGEWNHFHNPRGEHRAYPSRLRPASAILADAVYSLKTLFTVYRPASTNHVEVRRTVRPSPESRPNVLFDIRLHVDFPPINERSQINAEVSACPIATLPREHSPAGRTRSNPCTEGYHVVLDLRSATGSLAGVANALVIDTCTYENNGVITVKPQLSILKGPRFDEERLTKHLGNEVSTVLRMQIHPLMECLSALHDWKIEQDNNPGEPAAPRVARLIERNANGHAIYGRCNIAALAYLAPDGTAQ